MTNLTEVLTNKLKDMYKEINDFDKKTKNDAVLLKIFFEKWDNIISFEYKKGLYSSSIIKIGGVYDTKTRNLQNYIKANFPNVSSNSLALDYSKYNNYKFNYLSFLNNYPKLITDLEKTLKEIKLPNALMSMINSHILMFLLYDESVPKKVKKNILTFSNKKEKITNLDEYLGQSISFEVKESNDLIQNEICSLFSNNNPDDFYNFFISFIRNVLKLYNERKIDKEYIEMLNNLFLSIITILHSYGDFIKQNKKNIIKPFYNNLKRIEICLNEKRQINQSLLDSIIKRQNVYENYLCLGNFEEDILKLLAKYNQDLEFRYNETNDDEIEYIDEEKDIVNLEKEMIRSYVEQNVFSKFNCMSNAYNPEVQIDEEELYKNIPSCNKNEGFEIMIKILKSNNINHEINNLITRLYLYSNQKEPQKRKK